MCVGAPLSSAVDVTAPPQQGVLVVYSDARILPAMVVLDQTIRKRLSVRPPERLAYFNEFLDVQRFAVADFQERLAAFLADKYRGQRIDAVLCVRDAAYSFMQANRSLIAPGAPLIHITDDGAPVSDPTVPAQVVRFPLVLDAQPLVSLVRRLHPRLSTIAVVLGTSDYDGKWLATLRQTLSGAHEDVRWLLDLRMEEIEGAVAALPADAAVLMPNFMRDAAGRTYVPAEAAARVAGVSAAPVYVSYSTMVVGDVTGGTVFDIEAIAERSSHGLLRLLDGHRVAEIDLPPMRPDLLTLNWPQVVRWNIDHTAIPASARVLLREPDFWQRNRWWIIIAAAVIVLQAGLITALLAHRRRLHRTQRRLIEAERNMGMATEAAKLGIWHWDILRDDVWVSDGGRQLFALPAGVLTRAHLYERVHPDDRVVAQDVLQRCLASGSHYDHECRLVTPDGSVRWIASRGRVERDAQGRAVRLFGVSLDVSERKRMEGDVERHRSELAHLGRVYSLGELSGSIAHELNQPLAAILSNAEAALCHLDHAQPDLHELRAILTDIARQDRRASEVIRRMRALLRKGDTERMVLDLRQVVEEVLAMLRNDLLSRRVLCTTDLGTTAAEVLGDRVQLQQVVINLVVNAGDALVTQAPERRQLTITITQRSGRVWCAVADQGPGIPEGDHERVFEAFFSTKPHGIGMGLAICRSIITAHGGTLSVSQREGGGAVFCCDLPLAERSA